MNKLLVLLASASMFASVAMAAGNIYTGNFIGNGTGLTNLNLGLNLIQPTNTAVAMTNGLANNLTLTGTTTGAVVNVTTVNATTLVVTNAGVGTTISSNSVTTGTFNGSGAGLTALNPTNLTGGVTLPVLNGENLSNIQATAISGTLIQSFPTNTFIGYIPISVKFGTTNLFLPCVYTNQ